MTTNIQENMEKYDYRKEVTEDVRQYLQDNYGKSILNYQDREEAYDNIYDELFCSDSVTGNGSGSYFCSAKSAEEALCYNWGLMKEAYEEFGGGCPDNPESADVTIRCYLLAECLTDVLDEYYND